MQNLKNGMEYLVINFCIVFVVRPITFFKKEGRIIFFRECKDNPIRNTGATGEPYKTIIYKPPEFGLDTSKY
jgi:hypothetical protein